MALKYCRQFLTPYEQSEALEFPQIYYWGARAKVSDKVQGVPHAPNNSGYDDDHGDYRIVMRDHINYRFEVVGLLGEGSFGKALKVFDHKNRVWLALKIVRSRKKFNEQAIAEVKLLKFINDRVNSLIFLCLIFDLI